VACNNQSSRSPLLVAIHKGDVEMVRLSLKLSAGHYPKAIYITYITKSRCIELTCRYRKDSLKNLELGKYLSKFNNVIISVNRC
jgi:hypothetical protein